MRTAVEFLRHLGTRARAGSCWCGAVPLLMLLTLLHIKSRDFCGRQQQPPAQFNDGSSTGQIPKLLHYVFRSGEVFSNYSPLISSCLHFNPDWTVYLWRDSDVKQLIRLHYPDMAKLFDTYSSDLMRSDAARYLILHHMGGVYIDLDIECVRPFYPTLAGYSAFLDRERTDQTAVVWQTELAAMNSAMGSVRGHPFFAFVAKRMQDEAAPALDGGGGGVTTRDGKPTAATAYATTGPRMLTEAYRLWQLRRQRIDAKSNDTEVALLGWDFFSGFVESRDDLAKICRARFRGLVSRVSKKRPRGRRSMSYRICLGILRKKSWKREEATFNTVAFHRFMHLGYPENRSKIWGFFNVTTRFPRISFFYRNLSDA